MGRIFKILFSAVAILGMTIVGLAVWGSFQLSKSTAQKDSLLDGGSIGSGKLASWRYVNGHDDMRGTQWWSAALTSNNKPELSPPYVGGSPARIQLVQSSDEDPFNEQPQLILSNGQIDCFDCSVAIKFDDGPVLYSTGRRSDCGEEQCINLNLAGSELDDPKASVEEWTAMASFTRQLVKAKTVTVEVPIYRYGLFQYHFNVAGLIWPQRGAPAGAPKVKTGQDSPL